MFIVTDLTRFSEGNPSVCTALIDFNTGRCVRPMPYFTYDVMRRHRIMPGAKFSGVFTSSIVAGSPHIEDCTVSDIKHHGPANKDDFRNILLSGFCCRGIWSRRCWRCKIHPACKSACMFSDYDSSCPKSSIRRGRCVQLQEVKAKFY